MKNKEKEYLKKKLNEDIRIRESISKRNGKAGSIYNLFFPNHIITYIKTLRRYSYYRGHGNLFERVLSKFLLFRLTSLSYKLGFYIPKDVFGPGLYIPHFGSILINPNAKIGKYCQINNNVVIGQVRGKSPVIGDNVFIGSGAVICGDVIIANNCWIGANAVVTKSFINENCLIAGNPAKEICRKENNWVEELKKQKEI